MFNFLKKAVGLKSDTNKLVEVITEINESKSWIYSTNDLKGIKAYEELKKLPDADQKELLLQLNNLLSDTLSKSSKTQRHYTSHHIAYFGENIIMAVQGGILRRKLNYTELEWIALFQSFIYTSQTLDKINDCHSSFNSFPINYAIKQIEYTLKESLPSEELTTYIAELLQSAEFENANHKTYYGSDLSKAYRKLKDLITSDNEANIFSLGSEDIGDSVNNVISTISENTESYHQLFNLASSISGATPSAKLAKEIVKLQDEIGLDAYRKIAQEILTIPINTSFVDVTTSYSYGDYTETTFLHHNNQQFIKGMVWTMNRFSDKETILILSRLTEKSYSKIPGKGPAAASIGNACVKVLGNMRGKDGLGALSRLKLKVRQNNVKKSIDTMLVEGAKKYNVSVEELKEMAVPDFNLLEGTKTIDFDDYKLIVSITGIKVSQQWIKPEGTPMKSVPSVVKNNTVLMRKLTDTRKEIKEIQKVYSAQKQRIDNQFILDRSLDLVSFKKYYVNHGLVSPIAKKLIWNFTKGEKSANGILLDDKWYTHEHDHIDWIEDDTQIKLWHPVHAAEDTIIAWREKMMDLEWKQPVKQAFREIYILTDAEINTRNYSNRMAAHILKQHQFNMLASLRDWKYSLLGAYDDGRDGETCHKYLPEYKITAEYWIEEIHNDDDNFNDAGIWLYISTDQVKFKDEDGNAMDLIDVPKVVFTEIMRDVDMFVGVCSVGNDPQWMDNNGARQSNRYYWTSYSFGDLTEIAKTRKTILARLLPRLKKIRDKATIEGKFLRVEGKLRTYKIHIGSGNILMEPNDQYLCIVPSRSAESSTDRIFIPFEGDKGLSIVLSKAFLLAEDDKISDSTITSQINR